MSYELINQYYEDGLYSKSDLAIFVVAGYLTEKQLEEILEGGDSA